MKVLVGSFTAESNMFTPFECKLPDFNIIIGQEMIHAMHSLDLFEQAEIELIPTIFADGGSHGYIQKEAFDYIASTMLNEVKRRINDIDGIFLFLHGASHVNGLDGDSGEHYLLRKIRRIVGPYMPIAVVMDPHGNISQELANSVNIVRCYRHSPHTDIKETYRIVASLLIELLRNRRIIQPAYARVPILIGGERCVSLEKPLSFINEKLDEAEKSNRILSASYHVGFAWADSPLSCAGVMVVPSTEDDFSYAQTAANEIAKFAWSKRHDFHFTGNAMESDEALEAAFSHDKSPIVVSDSGDNTTAGSLGYNTIFLRQILDKAKNQEKRVLVCAIHDPRTLKSLLDKAIGYEMCFNLGLGIDVNSASLPLSGKIVAKKQVNCSWGGIKNPSNVVTVSVGNVDVAIVDSSMPFVRLQQFEDAGLNPLSYNIVVVKQGYLFPELLKITSYPIMALTPGATYQLTEKLPYKTIYKPMYPFDAS